MSLPRNWRLQALNDCGQTIAANGCKVEGRLWKWVNGEKYWSSFSTFLDNGSTVADDAYATGSDQDNSADKYIGFEGHLVMVWPASAGGSLTLRLQNVTGASNDDPPTDGQGDVLISVAGSSSATIEYQLNF